MTISEPLVNWSDDWPLPSWLGKATADATWHSLRVLLADGSEQNGVLARALLHGSQLTVNWLGQAKPTLLQWGDVTAVILMVRLQARATVGHAEPNPWDIQIAQGLFLFRIEFASGHEYPDASGHTMGYLWARHGLFLYVAQADGHYQGRWYSAAAIKSLQIDGQPSRAPADPAARPADPARPRKAAPRAVAPMPVSVTHLLTTIEGMRARTIPPVRTIIRDLGFIAPNVLASRLPQPGRPGFLLGDLVAEGLLSQEQSHQVLSRLAGVAEVDLFDFQVEADAGALALGEAKRYGVWPLGSAGGAFFLASSHPTGQETASLLSSLLERHVELVWASAASIDEKLENHFHIERNPAAQSAP